MAPHASQQTVTLQALLIMSRRQRTCIQEPLAAFQILNKGAVVSRSTSCLRAAKMGFNRQGSIKSCFWSKFHLLHITNFWQKWIPFVGPVLAVGKCLGKPRLTKHASWTCGGALCSNLAWLIKLESCVWLQKEYC